jgi:hypothetical protein
MIQYKAALINKILTISEISRSFATYYMIISKNNDFLSGISHLRKKKKDMPTAKLTRAHIDTDPDF